MGGRGCWMQMEMGERGVISLYCALNKTQKGIDD